VSLEDELMRRFGGDRLKNMMDTLGLPEDQPIQNAIISKTIESAQSKIEGYNFDIRKHVLDYDDVMNKQREVVYKKRKEILGATEVKQEIMHYVEEEIERNVSVHCVGEDYEWNIEIIGAELQNIFPFLSQDQKKLEQIRDDKSKNTAEKISLMLEYAMGKAKEAYIQKETEIGADTFRQIEKAVVLQTIDTLWMNHLDEIDYLRQGIGLRGYGQRDPLIEYKREAFNLFSHLMENMRATTVRTIFKISMVSAQPQAQIAAQPKNIQYQGAEENISQFGAVKENGSTSSPQANQAAAPQKPIINDNKVGRNDPCSCGSGKKYKKCCGK
jgi:preprotein translocase subunit SecA